MKKTLLTIAALSLFASHVFAQGAIAFNASSGNKDTINFSTDGTTSTAYPLAGIPTFGSFNVGFFAAPDGTKLTLNPFGLPDFTQPGWTAVTTVLPANTSNPQGAGAVFGNGIVMPIGTAGNNIELEVVAWSGTDTTWFAAVADAAKDLLGFSGDSFASTQEGGLGWSQGTVSGALGTPVPIGAATFNGVTLRHVSTPEPSTILLGGMGAAMLVLFRFLKNRKTQKVAR